MSDIRFRCPECRGKLSIAAAVALREVPCPLCGERITPWGNELLDIRFRCPECKAKLVVDRAAAGAEVSCPKCTMQIPVPNPAGRAVPPPPSVEATPAPAAPQAQPPPAMAPPPPVSAGVQPKPKAGTLSDEEIDFLISATAPDSADASSTV